jgi:ligand-binding sensor domain-containing protein/signal transduction histidine kinase
LINFSALVNPFKNLNYSNYSWSAFIAFKSIPDSNSPHLPHYLLNHSPQIKNLSYLLSIMPPQPHFMKNVFIQFSLALSILFAGSCQVHSQEINPIDIPLPKGTFNGIITCITQDKRGFMWFATTATGFYRYDGYNITLYKNQPLNPNSVALNRIETMVADSAGNIWVGTFGKGLDKFDPLTGKFTHYRHDPKNNSSLKSDSVMVIIQDHAGKMLWIGTRGGLDRFDPETGEFVHYQYDANDPQSLSHNVIRTIYEDRQGTLWVGTGSPFKGDGTEPDEGGLNKLDQKTGKFTRYMNDPNDPQTLIDNRVRAIFEDSHGIFWVGTAGDGLHTMDRATGKFERHLYDPKNPEKLSRPPLNKIKGLEYVDDHITFINEDATGAIWIGTLESGLNRYDPQTQKIKYFKAFNYGWWSFTSRDGVLWISTYTSLSFGNQDESDPKGPNLAAPVKAAISRELFKVDPFRKKILYTDLKDAANSIYEESPGVFWIGTQGSGLIRDDKTQGIQQKFQEVTAPNPVDQYHLINKSVTVIRVNPEGNLWLGTNGGGVDLFNKKMSTFTHYQNEAGNKSSLSDNHVLSLFVDKDANLWIGTQSGVLDYLNTKTNVITHYNDDSMAYYNSSITSILEDRQSRVWVGSYNTGLYLLNRQTGKFKHYLRENNITSSIYQDKDGTIWVGTKDGLYRYDAASDVFSPFTDPNSKVSLGAVLNILEDLSKNLWIVTGTELIRLNSARNESTRFGRSQGVNPNSLAYGDNGSGGNGSEIFYGDQGGYYVFQPQSQTVNIRPPQILLTDFRIADKSVEPGKNGPLMKPLWSTDQIRLRYNQDNFSFEFVAMHYSNPRENRIMYKLENYDVAWHELPLGQRAYYFSVPPGNYNLKVKATNGNGFWNEKDIKLTITPPWWRTWWAYTLFALILLGAIWGFIFYRSRKLLRENRVLEEKVSDRTAQLKQSLEDLKSTQTQLIQREKMASLGELTAGIAHEIQNPLNFVNNFSEVNVELSDELKEKLHKLNIEAKDKAELESVVDDIIQNQQKINHHGKRADGIVKGMLQHSRTQTGLKEPTDINALADEYLRLSYHGLRAKDKSFNATLQTDYDKSIGKINIIPQDVGRVLLNLYNNAFYAVNEKKKKLGNVYEPLVSVKTTKIGDHVEIRVRDNGFGIPPTIQEKIFHPFFTTKPSGKGTGLGLSLSYDVIKSHGGELKVETKEGEYAEFIIDLPVV